MSEIKFTDQRPRTTKLELPEEQRAKRLPPDPEIQAGIERLREKFMRRSDEFSKPTKEQGE